MATITKTIGTSGRDYSTITLWEASIDSDAGAGNDNHGVCYNDSAFDENVLINYSTTDNVLLTVAEGERHDGTAGTGARIVNTSGGATLNVDNSMNPTDLEWLEIDKNGNGLVRAIWIEAGNTSDIRNVIIHGQVHSATAGTNAIEFDANGSILNSVIYDIHATSGTKIRYARGIFASGAGTLDIMNCSVFDVTSDNEESIGIITANSVNITVNNCISMDTDAGTGTAVDYNFGGASTVRNYNMSSDATADGANSLTNKLSSDQWVSTTGGSEDLHLKSGADAIDAGTDLGTTPAGVEIDIDGRDRDAQGDTWDMGADELVSAATVFPEILVQNQLSARKPVVSIPYE